MAEDDHHTAPVPTDVAPRTRVLGDRYLLEERIASGGMAAVWRAHDETLARTVAVKILHEHLAADAALRERFRREAVAAAKLGHSGVVGIYDTGEEGGRTYLVMEYVEGETLRSVLNRLGMLEIDQAAAIAHQVAAALAYAHSHDLVHRDVKPANILISGDGAVKVADFGIAKAAQAARDLTQTGTVLGTAAYVAPEQVRGEPADGAADQYSLGCVVYEAITGSRPFESESTMTMATRRLEEDPLPLRSLRPDVPKGLDEIVLRALAREPEQRYPDMRAFATALGEWVGENGTVRAFTEEAATQDVAATSSRPSFLRSEGTWLASVLALVTVAATLVAVSMGVGVFEPEQVPSLTASDHEASDEEEDEAPSAIPIDAEALSVYDPDGTGSENDERLPNLLDGDPDSSWRTHRYNDLDFGGGVKPGVGFVIDLGETYRLDEILLTTPLPGANIDLRVADAVSSDPEAWETAAELRDIGESVRANLGGAEARYVLVYIVPELVAVEDDHGLAALSGIEIRGHAP